MSYKWPRGKSGVISWRNNRKWHNILIMKRNSKLRISLDHYLQPLLRHASIFIVHHADPAGKHFIPEYHIHYVYKGVETWTLEDGSIMPITGGHIGILQPDVYHGCEYNMMSPVKYLSISPVPERPVSAPFFSINETEYMFKAFKNAGNRVISAPSELEDLFIELHNLTKESKKDHFIEAKIRLLLAQATLCIAKALSLPPKTAHNYKMEKAKRFIEQNYQHHVYTPDIAKHAGLKPAHFNNLFRKYTGRTPADYHLWFRCEKSKAMLSDSMMTITDIAYNLCFSSSNHFSTCFRKYFGISPSQYRNARLA